MRGVEGGGFVVAVAADEGLSCDGWMMAMMSAMMVSRIGSAVGSAATATATAVVVIVR